MKVIIFAKTISVNLAVENKVINVITIFENASATSISAQVMEGAIQLGRYYIAVRSRMITHVLDE